VSITPRAIGTGLARLDGPDKVRGLARYAFEQPVDRPAHVYALQATIATGRISGIDADAARAEPGVLAVITHRNVAPLASVSDGELGILQSDRVAFRGQFVGAVVAETSEAARQAASLVRLAYEAAPHDVELRADRDDLYAPGQVNGWFDTDSTMGDIDVGLASSRVRVDETYRTPMYYHNPMEPHSTTAIWTEQGLTLYVSTQGVHAIRLGVAEAFGLDPQRVRVISPHVGGAFGSKVRPHPDLILAVLAARAVSGRPVRFALTRQQTFTQIGHRTPTIQRVRFGAGADGRLLAFGHDAIGHTSRLKEFAEQAATPGRVMYAAPNRRTTHRLARLDLPTPDIMRAPGKTPGMFALESAMDELAVALGTDPIELRIGNEPEVDPELGIPFSSRNLVGCLREGARRFGWSGRDPIARARREDGWLVGTGVAASMYPVYRYSGSSATVRLEPGGRYVVSIGAADLGTGTWTALTQIAADALEVPVDAVELRIGDTALPMAQAAGGSAGINTWGSTIIEAAGRFRLRLESEYGGRAPADGLEVTAETPDNPYRGQFAMHGFGALFAEVRVHEETGEVRAPRLLGVFAVGRIINARTGRSQLIGGMTMGLSMALHEQGFLDPRFGEVVNHDLAEYHIATNADVGSVEAYWLDEHDPYVNPMGSKGIGEIGIVGMAAAVANATYHATGIRVRDLPITVDKLLVPPSVVAGAAVAGTAGPGGTGPARGGAGGI
jgi:xanthine dehydrogenase YagR molybdenum-binding subunit